MGKPRGLHARLCPRWVIHRRAIDTLARQGHGPGIAALFSGDASDIHQHASLRPSLVATRQSFRLPPPSSSCTQSGPDDHLAPVATITDLLPRTPLMHPKVRLVSTKATVQACRLTDGCQPKTKVALQEPEHARKSTARLKAVIHVRLVLARSRYLLTSH